MSNAFVWFHNSSSKPGDAVAFYESLLGWTCTESPPGITMFAGENGPFAAVGAAEGQVGWIPFVQVDDVDGATKKAQQLGASILTGKTRGPAGEYTIIRDPGGAVLGLWQQT